MPLASSFSSLSCDLFPVLPDFVMIASSSSSAYLFSIRISLEPDFGVASLSSGSSRRRSALICGSWGSARQHSLTFGRMSVTSRYVSRAVMFSNANSLFAVITTAFAQRVHSLALLNRSLKHLVFVISSVAAIHGRSPFGAEISSALFALDIFPFWLLLGGRGGRAE